MDKAGDTEFNKSIDIEMLWGRFHRYSTES